MDEMLIKQITAMVLETLNPLEAKLAPQSIPVGISARHIHLTQEHVEMLFGKDYTLTKKKTLMGGQYACEELVTIVGTKLRAIENVRILGPVRKASQVEISKTDAIKLGINPPVRDSGDIRGSEPISIIGPKGAVYLKEGCIIAKRHIHMSEADAEGMGVQDKALVSVQMKGGRSGVLQDVLIRVDPSFTLEMHIDTDEANALGLSPTDWAVLV